MSATATLHRTLFTVFVVMSASLAAIVFAVHSVGMFAFFDRAVAARAVAFFIGHGTDSLRGGCLRLASKP
jgi:hypothetical protein